MTPGVVQRRIVAGRRTHAIAPVNAFIRHLRRRERSARGREKELGVVVKTLGNKAFQRLSAQHDTLECAADTLDAQYG